MPPTALEIPWHAMVAATYAHAAAPLRRLADGYVVETALTLASRVALAGTISGALERLPRVMRKADIRERRIGRPPLISPKLPSSPAEKARHFSAFVRDVAEVAARGDSFARRGEC